MARQITLWTGLIAGALGLVIVATTCVVNCDVQHPSAPLPFAVVLVLGSLGIAAGAYLHARQARQGRGLLWLSAVVLVALAIGSALGALFVLIALLALSAAIAASWAPKQYETHSQ